MSVHPAWTPVPGVNGSFALGKAGEIVFVPFPEPEPASAPTKVCTGCLRPKPLTEFYVQDRAAGRRKRRCIECCRSKSLARYRRTGQRGGRRR